MGRVTQPDEDRPHLSARSVKVTTWMKGEFVSRERAPAWVAAAGSQGPHIAPESLFQPTLHRTR